MEDATGVDFDCLDDIPVADVKCSECVLKRILKDVFSARICRGQATRVNDFGNGPDYSSATDDMATAEIDERDPRKTDGNITISSHRDLACSGREGDGSKKRTSRRNPENNRKSSDQRSFVKQ